MTASYRHLSSHDLSTSTSRQMAVDVLMGLCERPRRLSSRYFYDDRGSELFKAICDTPDYYPTRVEAEILTASAANIMGRCGEGALRMVDLGAGDGRKTSILLEAFEQRKSPLTFVPIDISEGAMSEMVTKIGARFPWCEVRGIVGEYFDSLRWLSRSNADRSLVLFLGSNIGNFDHRQGAAFLRQLWDALNDGDMVLIGFDLKKDIEVLLRAYNDSEGITREFNMNLLRRLNRELGADFDLNAFQHFATYNVQSGAMESYLVSQREQSVRIEALKQSFQFSPFEPIHTEYSYKYLESDVEGLATDTGFTLVEKFFDERRYFMDALLSVNKSIDPMT